VGDLPTADLPTAHRAGGQAGDEQEEGGGNAKGRAHFQSAPPRMSCGTTTVKLVAHGWVMLSNSAVALMV
jgi:hypothetical protein